jgi:threonine dehydratase
MQTSLPLHSIYVARQTIHSHLEVTPLQRSPAISERLEADVWLKLENRQPTGSFKVRGALNMLEHVRQQGECSGVITGSAGNHGLGVAFAAQTLGIETVTIVIPENAPESKKMKLRRLPVKLIEEGGTYEDAHQVALRLAAKNSWTYIPAYDDIHVIAGQGTIGLEIMESLPETDVVVVPVGGGGLIAGIANAIKSIKPICEIIGVQAAASPSGYISLREGQPYDPYDHQPTIADGLAGGFGKLPFYLARLLIDRIALASEDEFRQAVYTLLKHEQLLVEPSGAISTHPLVRAQESWRGRTVVCVISGGNLSLPLLKEIIARQDEASRATLDV